MTISDHGVPAKSTTARVIVRVLDENDNRPQFLEKIYKIKLPERERADRERVTKRAPVYRVVALDRDTGPNAEISYSIEDGDERGKFFIEPKTGAVSSKKFSSAGEYDILTVSASPDTPTRTATRAKTRRRPRFTPGFHRCTAGGWGGGYLTPLARSADVSLTGKGVLDKRGCARDANAGLGGRAKA